MVICEGEGDQANTMFFLISGRLRVSRRDRNGALQLYNEIRPGEVMAAL